MKNNNSTKNIESILNSGEYHCNLSEALSSILSKVKDASSEATVASIFENELYFFIKTYFKKDIVFQKEIGETYLRHKFDGRIDAVSFNLVIEYKAVDKLDSERDRQDATSQVEDYLTQLAEESNIDYSAILLNGLKIKYFNFQNGEIYGTPFRNLEIDDLDRLVRTLVSIGKKEFVPQNVVKDFRLNSSNEITQNLAKTLLKKIQTNVSEKTSMLFQEWQVLFRLSENDRGQNQDIVKRREVLSEIFDSNITRNETDYQALFVLQTTYAIIVKLIACKVISKLAYNDDIMYFSDLSEITSNDLQRFIEKLEDGYVFSAGGIRNLLEGDFFSWYSDIHQWDDDISQYIKSLITVLEDYASSALVYEYKTIDIFKDLYMEIMPNEVRHSLGEYFTPLWLADQIVDESIKMVSTPQWNAIDPCCGSGIFVISLIKKILEGIDIYSLSDNERSKLLFDILNRVKGIDINPLSVLTARVSYLLSILPLISNQKIEISIYLGDSADIPKECDFDGVICYRYIVKTKQENIDVTLPKSFVESPDFFENMSLLQSTIKADDESLVYSKFTDYIDEDDLNELVCQKLKELSQSLVMLHKNNWDGIWIRIVSNFMLIARVEKQDIIIGNPPWVKWEYLPQNYAENIKKMCLERHLFSGQTYMGAISLNLCALIANVTASSWLNDDGVLAFIMPKTLMTQDSYAGFRDFYIDYDSGSRLFLQKVDDWSKSGNPFIVTTEKFLSYYYKKNFVDYGRGIPMRYFIKKRGTSVKEINYKEKFSEVQQFFTASEGIAFQFDNDRTGFTLVPERNYERIPQLQLIIGESEYKARSGVEFTPAEVYFIEPFESVDNSENSYFFKNSSFNNSVHKVEFRRRFELETTFIRPVVKSPCVKEFYIEDSNNYCIFPYRFGNKYSIPLDELLSESQMLANYLIDNKELIGKQSSRSLMISMGDDFYSLSKVGDYTFGRYSVTFRDNTVLDASVVEPVKTPWGTEIMPICAKHCPYISMDINDRYIGEEEAYYICGILNSNIVKEYFKYTYSGRSYSINFNIKLPLYDSTNFFHRTISELSIKASKNPHDNLIVNNCKEEIESAYLEICKTLA